MKSNRPTEGEKGAAKRGRAARGGGFTLIELLVVMAIVAILASMSLPCLGRAKLRAHMVEEVSAGRQLMLGAQMYADDYSGAVFPGYVSDPQAVDDHGQTLSFPANARYPWRMAPYMGRSMALIYSGLNRAKLDELRRESQADYIYAVSLFPSLGINSYFIGGNQTEFPAGTANGKFGAGTVITKMSQAASAARLMVFMSARSAVSGESAQGYYQVTPPRLTSRQWAAAYGDGVAPAQWGFVAPRFERRAVAALLDGHAENFNLTQMQDMRHWCNRAEAADWALGR